MQPYEELSLLIESVEDDIACADARIAWAIKSQRWVALEEKRK